MADLLGTGPSDEKETENEDKKEGKRPWDDTPKSEKIVRTPELAETLGFYDMNAVRREQRERENSDPSLARFLCAELTRGYFLEHNEAKYTERRERVYTCMRIPRELEKLMIFGFFLCLDAFLYVFTLLPLRVLLALLHLFTLPCCGLRANVCPYCNRSSGSLLLQPAQVCDILKGLIMVLCYSMMHYVDYSMMYHLIRGQSVIKLYIIYNMLEVADRLFSSFGQDILDALYWTATEPKERKRDSIGVIPHFIMAVFYVFLHAILIMVQASTLNVAFNSHNKSLLTIMMSNNFVEIKGSVFKKFEKNNLFQMSNSDIKERFTNYVLLLIVCLRNMEQFSWNPDHLWVLLPDVFMVIASEIAVDIIKHAFITKFNEITADVYSEYRASLAFDLVSSRQKNACTDYSDSVARRMGFIPLPLAVLLIRVVMSSVNVQGALSYSCLLLFYLGMVTLKVLNSIVLLGKSCVYVKRANMEDKLFEMPSTAAPGKTPSRTRKTSRCTAPSGDPSGDPWSERSPSSPSCTSITAQPTPTASPTLRPETVPPPPTTSTTPASPPIPEPDPDPDTLTPSPPATPEQKEEEGMEGTELKHRTPKKDLLDVDRFTICGNRID
ncbi:transmembrane anterior posterior transformation protein 1 homolog isoform X1 [Oncorhynchus nerka]|uniref:transmembrane anterior posterior transformation protein 1 homolog isoform X1 n=1 Tax=Oncorhynchus nerka TaxID=8023 RepID=UPI001130BA66|nr:transmembrane anterior posterior transformation protein 1 homolog isoform X1 [Oncorhynchus nerka]